MSDATNLDQPTGVGPVERQVGRPEPERKQSREQEAEANLFAIALLMPQHLVHAELDALLDRNKNLHEDDIVKRMARRFQVSEVMMTMRLVELGRLVAP